MQISQSLTSAINDQLNFEIYSAHIYLSMATWFESKNLRGMAHWMRVQYREELEHAMKFIDHIVERGGRAIVGPVPGPKVEWSSPREAFEEAYNHEKLVTQRIYKIGELADKEGDRATASFLKWFYDEQVEEEANTLEILELLKMGGDSIPVLMQIDARLRARE
ncbi:MAG: ferritin [Candidatus Thorarchaeota archaeon]